ncbi:hypothetical protein AB0L50_36645 [Streptomyces flaveolus]|uniref:hypothetical protein n=1 Tax=Streptomyces flaveolus TaxID=67297 RepID=UPI00343BE0CE
MAIFFCKSPGNFRISEAFSLKLRGLGLALAVVRDLRDVRPSATAEEVERFETDVLAGFVLARASVELADGTIRRDVGHLEQTRSWFGRPLWEMEPPDAVAYFGKVLRASPSGTRLGRSQALITYSLLLKLRHKVEVHRMTGRVIECPIDKMNRPRGSKDAALRIPPSGPEVKTLFAGWGGELATCRKFAPAARNYLGPGALGHAPRPPRQGRPGLGPARADGPRSRPGKGQDTWGGRRALALPIHAGNGA